MSEHELWNELGNLYFMSGAYDQAIHAYQRSIQMDAGFGQPYSNLALTYVQQGKYDKAIELYRRSIELLAENKEKAISWNRLGTVYRHLKDYSKAVIAFQEADELDPQNTAEFPAGTDADEEALPAPSSILEAPVGEQSAPEPQVDWWDVDENPTLADRLAEATATQSPDDSSASWTIADLSQYQQDVSELPDTGSLTTWGDTDIDPEFGEFLPLDPEPDEFVPEPDDSDLTTWLPIPDEEPRSEMGIPVPPFVTEEEPGNEYQAPVPAFVAETEPPADPPSAWNESSYYHIVESVSCAPLLPAQAADYTARIDLLQNSQKANQQAIEQQEVDVDVEDRPATDFTLAPEELIKPMEVEPIQAAELQPDPAPAPLPSLDIAAAAAETPALQRDEDELREIEKGIAKFKRVVQLNPRNAHAWDALGTLFKSAGLYKDAILAYQQAISNDASKSLYYHHLGLVYACEGRDEDAIGAFQRVIEIDPDYSLAHATLGGYYRKLGLEELAQKHIGKAMKNIFDSENEYNKACLEAICGNADQAIELLGVALKNKQTYVDWILRDPDLDFIRQDPRFKQMISDYTR